MGCKSISKYGVKRGVLLSKIYGAEYGVIRYMKTVRQLLAECYIRYNENKKIFIYVNGLLLIENLLLKDYFQILSQIILNCPINRIEIDKDSYNSIDIELNSKYLEMRYYLNYK